jgi:NAD(P)-dependent dehydrogenase (short-subunit alcohol dehydrogenase family)|tara:strand:+ start:126 stop:869 length:744 start_codon:yes stop_codon:yes gene_type:complete
MRLEGKVAIISGAASGIGQATAIRFAAEGARVIVADINRIGGEETVATIASAGGEAAFIETDVGDEAALQQMVDFAVATYAGLDVLHNNAYWTEARTGMDTTIDNWQRTLDVTLRPVWLATKLAVPHMQQRGGGVIINTASLQSIVGFPGYAAYQAAKGGVMSLTRALALELAPTIRVVAVLPGAINTPAVQISEDEGLVDSIIAMVPLRRLGEPEEIANTVLFLASDEAPYITGTGILVDGGYTVQ